MKNKFQNSKKKERLKQKEMEKNEIEEMLSKVQETTEIENESEPEFDSNEEEMEVESDDNFEFKETNVELINEITSKMKDNDLLVFAPKDELPVNDDIKREFGFMNQALNSVFEFYKKNKKNHRPKDYFAENLKSDVQMEKIVAKLMEESKELKLRETRKKIKAKKAAKESREPTPKSQNKRQQKDKKYGFGGKKKFKKSNDLNSTDDFTKTR